MSNERDVLAEDLCLMQDRLEALQRQVDGAVAWARSRIQHCDERVADAHNPGTDVTAELAERRALRAMVGILRRVDAPHEECGFCWRQEGQEDERAAVVAWLRARAAADAADAIERGEHVAGRGDE